MSLFDNCKAENMQYRNRSMQQKSARCSLDLYYPGLKFIYYVLISERKLSLFFHSHPSFVNKCKYSSKWIHFSLKPLVVIVRNYTEQKRLQMFQNDHTCIFQNGVYFQRISFKLYCNNIKYQITAVSVSDRTRISVLENCRLQIKGECFLKSIDYGHVQ